MREMVRAAVLASVCALPLPAHAAGPSFDCAKAQSSAEKMVCADASLAALDRETARLYGLARGSKHMDEARRKELTAYQRGWVKGRDDCWKEDDRRACIVASYVTRIHELRQGYADARKKDSEGVSFGPFALDCGGFGAGIAYTRVNLEPALVYLGWKDQAVVLARAAGAEESYAGSNYSGAFAFTVTGDNASFSTSDGKSYACKIERMG